MIIFAEYTSVSWELGEDKLDLLIDNSTRPLLYFQHGIFVDFKHDCISRQFSVLQCYLTLNFFQVRSCSCLDFLLHPCPPRNLD